MSDQGAPRTFAEKLNFLFTHLRPEARGEWSNEEVARGIEDRGRVTISATYVYYLRKGERDNPTKKHMEALADWFGVPPAYFFDDEAGERAQAQVGLIADVKQSPIGDLQKRAEGVSPSGLTALGLMLDQIRSIEGLPAVSIEPPARGRARPRRAKPDSGR